MEGRVADLYSKEIVALHINHTTDTHVERLRRTNGTYEDVEIQTRRHPKTGEEWKKTCRIFHTTLMMATCSHPEQPSLALEWAPLQNFYGGFLFGPTVMGRRTPRPQ